MMAMMNFASSCLLLACAIGAQLVVAGCVVGVADEGCNAEAEEAAMIQVKPRWGDQAGTEVRKAGADGFGYSTFQQGNWGEGYPLCSGQETEGAPNNQWQAPINFNLSEAYQELDDDDYPRFYAKGGGCKQGYFWAKPQAWQVNFVDKEHVDCTNLEMEWRGKVHELVQFHFHVLSEDTFDFNHLPMQMHMVHVAEDGSLAVVGVQVDYATDNGAPPNKFLSQVFKEGFETDHVVTGCHKFNPYFGLLKRGNKLWQYQGSLTTPPCSPGVSFLIAQKPVHLHREYVADYREYLLATGAGDSYGHNHRPAQPLNGRTVSLGEFGAIRHGSWAPPCRVGPAAVGAALEA